MQVSTGELFAVNDPRLSAIPKEDLVLLTGTPEAVGRISRNVKLGIAENERRAKRRKQQRDSRKRNR